MNPAPQPAWVLLAGGALGAQRTLATSVRAIDAELLVARRLEPAKGQLFTLRTNIEVSQLVVNEPVGGKYSVLLRLGRLRNGQVGNNASILALLDRVALKVAAISQENHFLDAQGFLSLFAHVRQLAQIVTLVGYFVSGDQLMLAVHHRLHVVADIAALARFHQPRVFIGQRYLALATLVYALL